MPFDMFRAHYELCDVVSLVLWCSEDDTFFIVNDELGYWIPSIRVEAGESWRQAAKKLLEQVCSVGEITKCCKIYRLWKPPGGREIHHVVFAVDLPLSNKEKNIKPNLSFKMFWSNCEDIQQSFSRLRSKELLDFLSVIKNTCLQRPKQYPRSCVWYEKQWSNLIDENPLNNVVEILENDVFPELKNPAFKCLLKCSGFSRSKQLGLYAHFLVECFPCIYMNRKIFINVAHKLGWDEKRAAKLFNAADVYVEGFLSYRDVLYILAVAEPCTTHGGLVGELRSRYIFRYYDRDSDNLLNAGEFRILVDDIIRLKKKTVCVRPSDVCHLTNSGGSDHAVTIDIFLELVGSLRLRGTSLLLRSPVSVTDLCPHLLDEVKFVNILPDESIESGSLTTRVVTFFPPPGEGLHQNNLEVTQTGSNSNFDVEVHYVQLTKDGGIVNRDSGDPIHRSSRLSIIPNPLSVRKSFVSAYKSAQEDLLHSIQFFIQEITPIEVENTPGRNVKPPFSWGDVDPVNIASSLLTVCEGVSRVMSMEHRLIELQQPVCVFGGLHGRFGDLISFEKTFWNLGPTLSPTTLLFLGDYADRGSVRLEVLAYLFARKIECPEKIILLRGSHEVRVIQQSFFNECVATFGDPLGKEIWEAINSAMDCMPLAAMINHKVFCSHGGIPPPWLCPVVSIINNIPCPLRKPDEHSPLAWELMWNEPLKKADVNEHVLLELEAKEGFAINPLKGTGHLFNANALEKFLKANGLSVLLRAHETRVGELFSEMTHLMLTLYTPSECEIKDEASCALVYPGKIRPFSIEQDQ